MSYFDDLDAYAPGDSWDAYDLDPAAAAELLTMLEELEEQDPTVPLWVRWLPAPSGLPA